MSYIDDKDEAIEQQSSASSDKYAMIPVVARIAVYDNIVSEPRVVEIKPAPANDYIESLATRIYELASARGGDIPYTVIREIAENFIHADFKEPVVSILDRGNTIMFADQGPGIEDKEKAQLPGFTSADSEMKRYIRGVGSGLPIVREFLSISGGHLTIEDNIRNGAVITISLVSKPTSPINADISMRTAQNNFATGNMAVSSQPAREPYAPAYGSNPAYSPSSFQEHQFSQPVSANNQRISAYAYQQGGQSNNSSLQNRISDREDAIMRLFIDHREVGQTDIKNALGISFATSTRTLNSLEEMGFLVSTASKKRMLTNEGLEYLQQLYENSSTNR